MDRGDRGDSGDKFPVAVVALVHARAVKTDAGLYIRAARP